MSLGEALLAIKNMAPIPTPVLLSSFRPLSVLPKHWQHGLLMTALSRAP